MEGELQRRLGHNLRAYRIEQGLSQEALATLLGVHRTYMGGVERGERNLTLRSVERIAQRLGIEPLALLTDEHKTGSRGHRSTATGNASARKHRRRSETS